MDGESDQSESAALPSRSTLAAWSVVAWALVLSVLLLGPALGRGFVLSYDMVWVPDLALRPDFLGIGSGLPRAVPSDAVVAVLDEVVHGELLQKLVLLGSLVGAGTGAARLVRGRALPVRLLAVALATWNPFVVERLVLGAWPVLIAYAVLPWIVDGCRRWRQTGRLPPALLVLVPLGSLSASAGLATAVALVLLALDRSRHRTVALLVLAANAPWLVSGLLHAASATSDGAGAAVFATRSEGPVPGPLAALTLGGVWNSEVVPASRTGALGWVALVVVLMLAVLGARRHRWSSASREDRALVGCWVVGWGLATLSWTAPGLVGALAAAVPGAGVVRDGSRLLLLCLPLLVLLVADGAQALWARLPRLTVVRLGWGAALVLWPLLVLPDVAWGVAGRLDAVTYPAAYGEARAAVARLAGADRQGDVMVLPDSSYRQPAWNGDRKVLDPLGRYLTPDYLASDVLVVGGVVLAGEDPRAAAATRALALATPDERGAALARLGIGAAVVDVDAPGPVPDVGGEVVLDAGSLRVVALDRPAARAVPVWWKLAMGLAWVSWLAGLLAAAAVATRRAVADRPTL